MGAAFSKVKFFDYAASVSNYLINNKVSKQDFDMYFNALKKEEIKLQSKKSIFEKVRPCDVNKLYSAFCQVQKQYSSDAYQKELAVKNALIGNTNANKPTNFSQLHDYLMSKAKAWRKSVEDKCLSYVADANFVDKKQVLDFCKTLQCVDLDIDFDPKRRGVSLCIAETMNEMLTEVKKTTKFFNNLNIFADPQEGFSYLHIYSNTKNTNPITIRLYMNIKPENRISLIDAIKQESEAQGISFYGKIACMDEKRNDNFLVYTNEFEAEKQINIINNLKNTKPQLFEGAENTAPIWGKLQDNEYIGIGEEPLLILKEDGKYTNTSYSAIRENIFNDYYKKYGEKYDKNTFAETCKEYGVSPENFSFNLDTARYSSNEHFNERIGEIKKFIAETQTKSNIK